MFGKLGGSHLFGDKKSQKNDSQTSTGLFGMPAPGATGASSGFGVLGDSSGPVASSSFSSASQSVFGSQGKPSATSSALFGAKPISNSSKSNFASFTASAGKNQILINGKYSFWLPLQEMQVMFSGRFHRQRPLSLQVMSFIGNLKKSVVKVRNKI